MDQYYRWSARPIVSIDIIGIDSSPNIYIHIYMYVYLYRYRYRYRYTYTYMYLYIEVRISIRIHICICICIRMCICICCMYICISYFFWGLTEGFSEYEPMDRWPSVYQGFMIDYRYYLLKRKIFYRRIDIICA